MIEIKNVSKSYKDLVALKGLNLQIDRGDLFGFIGPNGAGKTTTIKILATLLPPDYGNAFVNGFSVKWDGHAVRRSIGYMPDFFGIYDEMSVLEYLSFFGAAYGIKPSARKVIIDDVLELTDLAVKRDTLIQGLSRGMQQRLGLARVLVHDPEVLLLDEPASGLDPRARIEMKELLKELQNMGKTILISSHILTELAQLCNKIGIIEKGELLYSGTIQEVVQEIKGGRRIQVAVRGDMESAHRVLVELGLASVEHTNGFISAEVDYTMDLSEISIALFKAGLPVSRLQEEELRLEDVFMSLTDGGIR